MSQLEPNRGWLMIFACYSGSHLPALTQPHLLAMTAALDPSALMIAISA